MDYLAKAARVIDLEISELQRLRLRLGENFVRAVDLIKAAKAGDKAAQQQADAKWQQNAVEISEF